MFSLSDGPTLPQPWDRWWSRPPPPPWPPPPTVGWSQSRPPPWRRPTRWPSLTTKYSANQQRLLARLARLARQDSTAELSPSRPAGREVWWEASRAARSPPGLLRDRQPSPSRGLLLPSQPDGVLPLLTRPSEHIPGTLCLYLISINSEVIFYLLW